MNFNSTDADADKANALNDNPYRSPLSGDTPQQDRTSSFLFADAQSYFRTAILILAIPAIYNFFNFDQFIVQRSEVVFSKLYFQINLGALIGLGIGLWFCGYWLFEWLLTIPRTILFARISDTAWRDSIRSRMKFLMLLTFPGALVWFWWVHAFYSNMLLDSNLPTVLPSIAGFIIVAIGVAILLAGWREVLTAGTDDDSLRR